MGHIFISYSHRDNNYAHALADSLQSMGLEVWIDARLDYGSQWPHEIQKNLDSCDAFILIMSPRSFESDWVQSELQRAKRKRKPIFPLLLEGDEPWLSVESTQYYDVRDAEMPDDRFYSAIKRVISISKSSETLKPPKRTVKTSTSKPEPKLKTEIVVAIIGGVFTILATCATLFGGPLVAKWLEGGNGAIPTAVVDNGVRSNPTATGKPNQAVVNPPADMTLTSTDTALPPTKTATPYPEEITDSTGATMRLVSAGKFIMGSDHGEFNERPVHEVELSAFYMDVYEVTNSNYQTCVDVGPCTSPALNTLGQYVTDYYNDPQYGDYPVVYVNWFQARTYCDWRDAQLPTEAQWEKAARGTDGLTYPWGQYITCDRSNFGRCTGTTYPVGSYGEGISPYGLYDLAGNVWEWVGDWYSETYYGDSSSPNPTGPEDGMFRVLRGGSFVDGDNLNRSSFRNRNLPEDYNWNIGFRCAMNP